VSALMPFDKLYAQPNGQSALQQLQIQLANPLPYDLDDMLPGLPEYKHLAAKWHDWQAVKQACTDVALRIFEDTSTAKQGAT
jgi:hypothetical protein